MRIKRKIEDFQDWEQLELWQLIIGTTQLYKPVLSPFRPDSHIGGQVYLDYYNGKYVLTDFTNKNYHNTNVFQAIMYKFNLTYMEMVDFINTKELRNYTVAPKVPVDKKCYINYQPFHGYYKKTLEYFNTYGITAEDLWNDGVRNAHCVFVNHWNKKKESREVFTLHLDKVQALFTFDQHVKVYLPFAEKRFPISNTTKHDIWKIDNGCTKLIISTSYKDVRTAVNDFNKEYNGLAPQTEGLSTELQNAFNEDTWNWIKMHDEILVIGDNDAAGKRFQERLVEYLPQAKGFIYPDTPTLNQFNKKIKDYSELYRWKNTL